MFLFGLDFVLSLSGVFKSSVNFFWVFKALLFSPALTSVPQSRWDLEAVSSLGAVSTSGGAAWLQLPTEPSLTAQSPGGAALHRERFHPEIRGALAPAGPVP